MFCSIQWKEYEAYLKKKGLPIYVPTAPFFQDEHLASVIKKLTDEMSTCAAASDDSKLEDEIKTILMSSSKPQYHTYNWYECVPAVISLSHNFSSYAEHYCELWNYHKIYTAKVHWMTENIPSWLLYAQMSTNPSNIKLGVPLPSDKQDRSWDDELVIPPKSHVGLQIYNNRQLSFNR